MCEVGLVVDRNEIDTSKELVTMARCQFDNVFHVHVIMQEHHCGFAFALRGIEFVRPLLCLFKIEGTKHGLLLESHDVAFSNVHAH